VSYFQDGEQDIILRTSLRLHSHWHECRLRVIDTSETRTSGAFMVTRTSTNTCNSDAIKFGENCEIPWISCKSLLYYRW